MRGRTWDKVSQPAKDFIWSLLRVDPRQRLTAEAALEHPFLEAQQDALDVDVARQALLNLQNFDASSAALAEYAFQVARHLDQRSVRRLQEVFQALDTNADGELSKRALQAGFERVFGADSDELRDVDAHFVHADLTGSGFLSFTEFCAVALGGQLCAQDEALKAAFQDFGPSERCRQEVLRAAALPEAGEVRKNSRNSLTRWLAAARGERHAQEPLVLLCPTKAAPKRDDEPTPRASFYDRVCCVLSGRSRRAGRRQRRAVKVESVPVMLGMWRFSSFDQVPM